MRHLASLFALAALAAACTRVAPAPPPVAAPPVPPFIEAAPKVDAGATVKVVDSTPAGGTANAGADVVMDLKTSDPALAGALAATAASAARANVAGSRIEAIRRPAAAGSAAQEARLKALLAAEAKARAPEHR